ncbi:MAG: hypothetical protein AB1896_02990 [Thermodesulfobacteriota bacterium]
MSARRPLVFLLALLVFVITGCSGGCPETEPRARSRLGPATLGQENAGPTAPDYHRPGKWWRNNHMDLVTVGPPSGGGYFGTEECWTCHDPEESCNLCHDCLGAVRMVKP